MATSSIATTAGIFTLVSGVVIFYICIKFVMNYRRKKNTSTRYLTVSVAAWLGATWSAMLIYFFAGSNLTLAIISQKLVYLFVFLGTILTFLFGSTIFFKLKKIWIIIYVILGILAVTVMVFSDSVEQAVFPDGSGYPLLTIAFEYSLLIVFYVVPTTIGLMIVALRLSRRVTGHEQVGLRIIALGQLMILVTFVVDTIATLVIDDVILYSIFLYSTWVFPMLGAIFYDIGWMLPEWLKKRYQ